MLEQILVQLAPVISFLSYFAVAILLTVVFSVLYINVTPHNELKLIRGGNMAAAAQFCGVLIGYCIPLSSAIAHSVSMIDFITWGVVGLVIQLFIFGVVSLLIGNASSKITSGNIAVGVLAGTASIAAGIINSACMTY
jgi:putative membrane protein